jgi:signal peptidase I
MVAATTLKQIWKNEYFQTALMVILIVIVVLGFWYGTQFVMRTNYPGLAVASTSMLPTLNVGDLILVQGANATEINANYTTGDIVVFKSPSNPDKLIVHRAVKVELTEGRYWVTTHGDNNPAGAEETFPESNLIGKVVGKIPFLGNFALLTYALGNSYFFLILAIIILVVILAFPFGGDKEPPAEGSSGRRKLFGRLDVDLIYLLIVNVVLICLIVFSLWGSFTFWQIGADPPQHVTIRGMYPDLQFYDSFKKSYNYINETFMSHGLFTYKVDCLVDGRIRPGVPTFSWAQISLVILVVINIWYLIKFIEKRKTPEIHKTETSPDSNNPETAPAPQEQNSENQN